MTHFGSVLFGNGTGTWCSAPWCVRGKKYRQLATRWRKLTGLPVPRRRRQQTTSSKRYETVVVIRAVETRYCSIGGRLGVMVGLTTEKGRKGRLGDDGLHELPLRLDVVIAG